MPVRSHKSNASAGFLPSFQGSTLLNPSTHPEFTFFPIQDGLTAEEISSGNVLAFLLAINANCKASFRQCLTQVMEQEPDNKITCAIRDDLMYFTEAVAKDLNIPNIMLRTSSVTNVLARTAVLQLHSKGHIPFPVTEFSARFSSLRFKDLPTSNFDTFEKYSELVVNAFDVRTASAMVWNTTDCLEQSSLAQIQQNSQGPIEKATRTLMVGKEGEQTRQRAKDLKGKIKLSMKQGGSSYNSLNELVDLILSF
ncbi:hypothetical protein DVH24_019763 [Malus domestica]|uniref:Uncharacterized protein n=1 Tax=Malus domestica TaxID=3750 RepID=A0A498I459_MALDO|nr:hypothetical protein DVH24_019763 [Malus domestica]